MFSSFNVQICLLSSVELLLFAWRNDEVWFRYLVLKLFSVNPTYVKTCNCQQKNTCPLAGNCLQSSVIYQATVIRKDNKTSQTYVGLTENSFKTKYRNHTSSFRHANNKNSTELSKHIWTLKDENIEHSTISWKILAKA